MTKREKVYHKSNGRCWDCGESLLETDFEVDHFIPLRRDEGKEDKSLNNISNLVPSCRECNRYKTVFTIEEFRKELESQVARAYAYSKNFRFALKYNQVAIDKKPIVFYFEKEGLT